MDRAGRAARPRAHLQRAGRPARHVPRGGLAGAAHADGLAERPAAVGGPPPDLGPGEIEQLFEGQIHNGRTLLRLDHIEGESYAAFLSFARFPDVMSFPEGEPWLHYADSLPFPVEVSSRMKLIPPAKATKDVGRRLAHARDMDAHIREAGAEAPIALAEQIAAARMLEHGITKERLPFVYGWHRLIVAAPTRDLCLRRVEAVTEHYRDIGIDIVNSTGDQFSLLSRVAAGREGAAELVRAAPAAVYDRRRHADGDRRDRRPDRGRSGLDRPVHRRDAGPRPVGGALRPDAGRGAEPADRGRHHRRARRRQDHAGDAADLPARAARRDDRGDRPQGRPRAARGVPVPVRAQGPGAAAGRRRRPGSSIRSRSATTWRKSARWPPRPCACCCRG